MSIEYGKYLQDVSQSISTEEIVTVIRGLGEDNITAASATPTGYNEWEDYTYYLDGAELLNIVDIVQQKAEPRLNKSSRWMSDSLTIKLLLWLYAREEVEKTLYQEMPLYANGTEPAYRINGVMLSRNPREYFLDNYDIPEYAGVEPEKGFISVLDHIENLKILAAEELIPLKVKSSEFGTMLDILTENSSVTHLAT